MASTYPPEVLARLQDKLYEMLCAIADVCEEYGITYTLEGGTFLGAVRHGDFIPWDDDVDISMPWDSYHRFLEIAPEALPEGLSLHTPDNTPGLYSMWSKVFADGTRFIDSNAEGAGLDQGIFVDIFPIVNLEAGKGKDLAQVRKALFWQRANYLHEIEHPTVIAKFPKWQQPFAKVGWACARALVRATQSTEHIRERWEAACVTKEAGDTWAHPVSYPWIYRTEWMYPPKPIAFRDREFPGPAMAHEYLVEHYGETYMQLPPEEKRWTHAPSVLDFGDGAGNVLA